MKNVIQPFIMIKLISIVLYDWMSTITPTKKHFEFTPPHIDDVIYMKDFIQFDEWWKHFEELKSTLFLF